MKIWVNKTVRDELSNEYEDAVIFNVFDDNRESNIKTNFEEIWRRFSKQTTESIYEDFLIFAAAIYAIDKKIPRNGFGDQGNCDNWTRNLDLCLPVINIDKWNTVKPLFENLLDFLSGDKWSLSFRASSHRYRDLPYRKKYEIIEGDFDGVSLFSGGLDSFSGAIKLVGNDRKICFVGCMEYNQLNNRIMELYNLLRNSYPSTNSNIIVFSTNPKAPENIEDDSKNRFTENTSRSRSLLFIAGALATASLIGNGIPVYIPENGFIGLNLPLTISRVGSCSTRTTHVYFLNLLNEILAVLGIDHRIENFYSHKTKGEVVEEVRTTQTFIQGAGRTISCSHPTQGRIDGATVPINCGYCYPCLIRRAALNKIGYTAEEYLDNYNNDYKLSTEFIKRYPNPDTGRAKDLKATLFALYRYIHRNDEEEFIKKIIKLGGIDSEEISQFNRLYLESMEEIKEMIMSEAHENDMKLLDYLGLREKHEETD